MSPYDLMDRGPGDPDAHGYPGDDRDPGDEQPEPITDF